VTISVRQRKALKILLRDDKSLMDYFELASFSTIWSLTLSTETLDHTHELMKTYANLTRDSVVNLLELKENTDLKYPYSKDMYIPEDVITFDEAFSSAYSSFASESAQYFPRVDPDRRLRYNLLKVSKRLRKICTSVLDSHPRNYEYSPLRIPNLPLVTSLCLRFEWKGKVSGLPRKRHSEVIQMLLAGLRESYLTFHQIPYGTLGAFIDFESMNLLQGEHKVF